MKFAPRPILATHFLISGFSEGNLYNFSPLSSPPYKGSRESQCGTQQARTLFLDDGMILFRSPTITAWNSLLRCRWKELLIDEEPSPPLTKYLPVLKTEKSLVLISHKTKNSIEIISASLLSYPSKVWYLVPRDGIIYWWVATTSSLSVAVTFVPIESER